MLRAHPRDGALAALALSITALALSTVAGIAQGRAMTRSRRRAIDSPDDPNLASRVANGARRAVILRAMIAVLTVVSVVLGVVVAVG